MGKMPLTSIIVLNYNGKKIIDYCLHTVFLTDYDNFEVIFVDNGSTDGSVKYVTNKYGKEPRLRIIALDKNYGFSGGNNAGILASKGRYVVLLNNDVQVSRGWLKKLVNAMERDTSIGAAQPKILLEDKIHIDAAGCFIDYLGRVYQRGVFERDRGQYKKMDEIFYARGAAIILRRSVLNEVGVLDPDYFIYYEETDLCWRIWLRGYKVVYIPTSVVYHKGGATMGKKRNPEAIFIARRNHLMTLIKNYSLRNLLRFLPAILFRMALFSVKLALGGEFPYASAYIRAMLWILMKLKYIWKKRMWVQYKVRKVSDEQVMRVMLKPSEYEHIKARLKAARLAEF